MKNEDIGHTGTQTIETERLVLRRFTDDDAQAMYDTWATDPEVTRWLRWEPHKNIDETKAVLRDWVQAYEKPDYYHWAITLKDSGALIGAISISQGSEEHLPKLWEPGYCIGRAYWGKGYTSETLQAVVDAFTAATGVQEMGCCHAVENPASGRVMEKAGFCYDRDIVYHRFDGTEVPARFYRLKVDKPTALQHTEKGLHERAKE